MPIRYTRATMTLPLIRIATLADLEPTLEIYNHAVLHTTASYDYDPRSLLEHQRWYADKLEHGFPLLVAEQGGQVVGFATYSGFRAKIGYQYTLEHSVYVHPEFQGRGVGSALMPPLLEAAWARGAHVLMAGIDSSNAGSIAFHRRYGFVEVATLREVGFKFGRWLDLTFMQLTLNPGGSRE